MFTDEQLENYGKALIWGLQKMKKGTFETNDAIMIKGGVDAMPLLEVLYRKVLMLGLQPMLRVLPTETMELDYYTIAMDYQLGYLYPWWHDEYKHVRGNIYVSAPTSLTHLKDTDPKKQQTAARAVKPWREFITEQEQKDLFAWTLGIWPTQCKADKAGISLEEFKNQVASACYLDSDDVTADWDNTHNKISGIKGWLNALMPTVDYFQMQSVNMDLKVTPGRQRQFMGGGGANIPSFEIFTSPDWRGTTGTFFADQPSYRGGQLVKNVMLTFEDGVVVAATAEEGEEYLLTTLDTDEDAKKVGEFSLTDIRHSKIDRFMADTLFDENFGGTRGNSHIAIGQSYAETFTGDQSELTDELKKELGFTESVVHWDLINTEDKTVTAVMKDGSSTIIYRDGMFTI
jgi:aminopeptidase